MSKWVSCDERLPEPCVLVLTAIYGSDLIVPFPGESMAEAVDRIFSAPGHTSISFIGEDGLWCDGFFGGPEIVAPSYWMEFPAPPPNPKANRQENGEFAEALGDMFDRVLGEETMEEMTNADRIRSMTDEELANLINRIEPKLCHDGWDYMIGCDEDKDCVTCWLDWLKQEVSE